MAKLLLVEDDIDLAQMLCSCLQRERYAVDAVHRLADAREFLGTYRYEIIILDWQLPDGDGVQLCKEVRKGPDGEGRPLIIMLTALDTTPRKIEGLDSGADDYLTKPFETDELLARLRMLARRLPGESSSMVIDDLTIDLGARSVSIGGQPLELTAREFDLLHFLASNANLEFDVDTLRTKLWGPLTDVGKTAITTAISRLRSKLSESSSKIETGEIGYKFVSRSHCR